MNIGFRIKHVSRPEGAKGDLFRTSRRRDLTLTFMLH